MILLKTLSNEMAGKLVSSDPHDYYGSGTFDPTMKAFPPVCQQRSGTNESPASNGTRSV